MYEFFLNTIKNIDIKSMRRQLTDYLDEKNFIFFMVLMVITVYFLFYLVSFFFKLPVIILFALLIGLYVRNMSGKKVKVV